MEQLSPEEVRESHNVYPARDAERSQHAFDTERVEATGKTEAPIGVFDSGVGGLTVLSALRQELPHENYVYFGDTAHCPYGTRTHADIIELSGRAIEFLIEQGAKLIVLGCKHFPALRPVIERITRVQVIDSGAAIARRTHSVLEAEALMRLVKPADTGTGELQVWCS